MIESQDHSTDNRPSVVLIIICFVGFALISVVIWAFVTVAIFDANVADHAPGYVEEEASKLVIDELNETLPEGEPE